MARPAPTTITCPSCGQPFSAFIEQILDVGRDPTAKERLLSGRVNLITCPSCGYQGAISTPLMYHDPSKQMALVFVPMELNLGQEDREKLIGDMTNAVIRAMPEDAPKGYLLQPGTALTMQGMIELVLEADGITREMLDKEQRKVDLIDQMAAASKEELEQLIEDNQELFDLTFLELLGAAAQGASQQGDSRTSLRLLNLRSQLMETTEAGRELKQQQDALVEASQELKSLGDKLTREAFVDLIVRAADNPAKVAAFGTLGQGLLDYSIFQMLTEHIERSQDEGQKEQLKAAREQLLAIAAEYENQARAVAQRAADTLRMLLQASDVKSAIRSNLERIDETFMQVLQINLEEARKTGKVEVSSRLKAIRDEVLELIQQSAPPEIRLINEMLSAENEDQSLDILHANQDQIDEDLLGVMDSLVEQLRASGNDPVADRLEIIRAEAERLATGS